jgi:NADH-quinone oxidoreductase subunit G
LTKVVAAPFMTMTFKEGINMSDNKVTVYIDDVAYQVNKENNLLAGVLSQKLNLPYFCWHPSMGSVGACRQCAVTQYQDEDDTRGRLVMACTTPVSDGMRISLQDAQSSTFREQVIAAMMTNHPHDCPVCAEGGECHLQDMTVMSGHNQRDYQGDKRTFTNQNLGDLVGHEMNRCITCYRCVRFYKDYAGGKDFGVYGSRNQVYFGRQSDGALESEFSGNLVEVCPTGVFTNKVFSSHYTRKWDLQSAPSVCAHCSIGCNTSIGERYGSVRRVVNRYNADINGYFLCDRGRFGIGFVNGQQRLRATKGIKQTSPVKLTRLDVAKALAHYRGKKFIGIGSGRASLEANFYLKNLVGNEHFSTGLSAKQMAMAAQHQQLLSQYKPPSLTEIEQSDFIFIIDEDITQTASRMALSVRQALRNASIEKAATIGIPSWQDSAVRTLGGNLVTPLFSLQTTATKLDDVSEQSLLLAVDQIENCLLVLANYMNNTSEDVLEGISELQQGFIKAFVKAYSSAKRPLILSGWSSQSASLFAGIGQLMSALSNVGTKAQNTEQNKVENVKAATEKSTRLAIMPPQSNSIGLLSMIDDKTLATDQLFEMLASKAVDGVIVLEHELTHLTEQELQNLTKSAQTVIVLDHSESKISECADIILPVAPVSEGDGHYVNYQGQVQRYHQVHAPVLPIQDSWRWLDLLANTLYPHCSYTVLNAKNEQNKLHCLADLNQHFLSNFSAWVLHTIEPQQATARQTHRASGRTSQLANISVHEPKVTQSYDQSMRFSMEGAKADTSVDMPFSWAPGWNSNQSITQFQEEVGGELEKKNNNTYLSFQDANALIARWPVNYQKSKSAPHSYENNHETVYLAFSQKIPWYNNDWQASFNPEFQLMAQGNSLYVSSSYAEQQGWHNGQDVKVTFANNNCTPPQIATLYCDDNLISHHVYGTLSGLDKSINNLDISLSAASQEEIKLYHEFHNNGQQRARNNKSLMLEHLKSMDKLIPIRMVSGGLDDV